MVMVVVSKQKDFEAGGVNMVVEVDGLLGGYVNV